ncbi:hypothetical protein CGLO_12848 [Colletotrichum gloeosporioides Cg-14]|uniref:Uncharacterized protein n=1 Tax=Colletotrichum gloeosporioides (strain Cg-14) TaxID=1237896 RepID=T0K7M1_COLGC|nr:hypothetical protein CGLO_12848 [Colletotrichum gloeosporioides Cg-14]
MTFLQANVLVLLREQHEKGK